MHLGMGGFFGALKTELDTELVTARQQTYTKANYDCIGWRRLADCYGNYAPGPCQDAIPAVDVLQEYCLTNEVRVPPEGSQRTTLFR